MALNVEIPSGTVVSYHGEPGKRFPITFGAPGTYHLTASIDGKPIGMLDVLVVAVDLKGPIACLAGFRRIKDVALVIPPKAAPIAFVAGESERLLVGIDPGVSAGNRLLLQPLTTGKPVLQARLGDVAGPIVAAQPIDVFTVVDSAAKYVSIIQAYPDGSLLCQGTLTMSPWVPDLDIHLRAYIAGVTFGDSATTLDISTNWFSPFGEEAQYVYDIIRAPSNHGHTCHTWAATQQGVPISP